MSLSRLKLHKAVSYVEETDRGIYLVAVFWIARIRHELRYDLSRAYDRGKSIGSVRNLIRGKYASSRGYLAAHPPYVVRPYNFKVRHANPLLAVERIAKKNIQLRHEATFENDCECYRLYYPEVWPGPDRYKKYTPDQFGALIRHGTPLALSIDQHYLDEALAHDPEIGVIGNAKAFAARIKSVSSRYGFSYYRARKVLFKPDLVVGHYACVAKLDKDVPPSFLFQDECLECFDDFYD